MIGIVLSFLKSKIGSFIGSIPIRHFIALLIAAGIGIAVWVGYGNYKDLQNELTTLKIELTLKEVALKKANLAIEELERQYQQAVINYTELERRRKAIEEEWQNAILALGEINGDCTNVTPVPGIPDPAIDALNRVNDDANRMLRQE